MIQTTDYLLECRNFYNKYLLSEFGQPEGSQEEKISFFEGKYMLRLPKAYRQYLLWMGNDIAGVFRGSEWFLKDLVDNNQFLPEFLDENKVPYNKKKNPICFFSHQGYMAAWFYLNESDNPDCYFYSEVNSNSIAELDGRFSDFLLKELHDAVKSMGSINGDSP